MTDQAPVWGVPDAILFDWDSTLVSTFEKIKKSMNETLTYFGKAIWDDDQVRKYTQLSAKEGLPLLFGNQWPLALDIFTKSYDQTGIPTPFPGALSFLNSAHRLKIPMAVISNKRGDILRDEVNRLGWDLFFHSIIGSGDLSQDKPSPLPVYHVLGKMGVVPSRTVWFIGDAPVDWECADESGCLPIPLGKEREESKKYPHCIEGYKILEKKLRKSANLHLVI